LRLASQNGQPIHEILTNLMEEVDQLAKNLWPPVLERLGLGMALQTQLAKLAQVECEKRSFLDWNHRGKPRFSASPRKPSTMRCVTVRPPR